MYCVVCTGCQVYTEPIVTCVNSECEMEKTNVKNQNKISGGT